MDFIKALAAVAALILALSGIHLGAEWALPGYGSAIVSVVVLAGVAVVLAAWIADDRKRDRERREDR